MRADTDMVANVVLVAYNLHIRKPEYRGVSMAKILIKKDGQLFKEVPIISDRTRIGREKINQIRIVNSTISRFHAEIHRRGFCYVIEDKQSTNGTHLNGSLLSEKETLNDNDEIVIGEYTLVFIHDETDSPEVVQPESFDSTTTVFDLSGRF